MDEMVGTVRVLGETLLHFLWQGAVIGVVAGLALKAAAFRSAHFRYLICLLALFTCLAAPFITATLLADRSNSFIPTVHPPAPVGNAIAIVAGTATASVPEIATDESSFDFMRVIVGIWLLGVLSVTTYYGLQWRGVDRVRRAAMPLPVTGPLTIIAQELLRRWKATVKVPVLISELVSSPVVIGVFRPIIVFPAATLARMPCRDFELILLHEIAHILRRDTWINAMQLFLEIVFFYHPAVHWLSRRARLERECACDDFVVDASGSAYQYAQALTTLALAHNHRHQEVMALGATGGDLLPRLRHLAGECTDSESYPRNSLQFALLGLLIGLVWLGALLEPLSERWTEEPMVVPIQAKLTRHPLRPVESITLSPFELPARPRETMARSDIGPASHDELAELENPRALLAASRAADSTGSADAMLAAAQAAADATGSLTTGAVHTAVSSAPLNAAGAPAAEQTNHAAPFPVAAAEISRPEGATPDASNEFPEVPAAIPVANALSITTTSSPMPEYPLRARLDGIEGKVSAIVRVGPDGWPKGLQIVSAEPLGVFEGSVRRALMQWRYDMSSIPETSKNMQVAYQLNFTISGIATTATGICATATASRTCLPR